MLDSKKKQNRKMKKNNLSIVEHEVEFGQFGFEYGHLGFELEVFLLQERGSHRYFVFFLASQIATSLGGLVVLAAALPVGVVLLVGGHGLDLFYPLAHQLAAVGASFL